MTKESGATKVNCGRHDDGCGVRLQCGTKVDSGHERTNKKMCEDFKESLGKAKTPAADHSFKINNQQSQ